MKKILTSACIALSGLMAAQIPTSGLMYGWEFSNTLNDSYGGNHGTWNGTGSANYALDRCGVPNSAISLNGTNNFIQTTLNGPLGNAARSISFWMKTSAASNNQPKAILSYGFGYPLGTCTVTAFEINYDYGCMGVGPDNCTNQYNFKTTCLYDGNWHHVVSTYATANNISQVQMYVDGTLLSSSCGSGATGFNTQPGQPIRLGSSNLNTASRLFGGQLDDIYVYNRVLTAAEIMQLFSNQCQIAPCTSTVVVNPPDPKGCCLGNLCSSNSNPLLGDYEIPLGGNDFNFSGDDFLLNKVNVGYNCSRDDIGKFNAKTEFQTNTLPMDPNSISIYGTNTYNFKRNNGTGVGVMGYANGVLTPNQFSGFNIGVAGLARPSSNWASSAFSAPYTYNLLYQGGANIGVYGAGELQNTYLDPSSGSWVAGGDWAAWFDGDVKVAGSGWINNVWISSDRRFKSDIAALTNVTDKIRKINGYSYSYNTTEFKTRGFDNAKHIGLIAQEVNEVFPELIRQDSKGYYAVDYQGMVPVLLTAIKEQQQQIDELKALVMSQKSSTEGSKTSIGSTSILLSDKTAIVLNQNVPNPFAESTVITYAIPTDFAKAQIIFSTTAGTVIKVIEIKEKGSGVLNVFADDLTHGTYTYSLVVDGKTIDTKRITKQ